jgi:hypothetical protein
LEMVQQRILALEQMNLEIVVDSTVYSTVRELMALFGARPIGINTSNHIYRIRRNLDERLHSTLNFDWYPPLFSTVSQLWYPPSEGTRDQFIKDPYRVRMAPPNAVPAERRNYLGEKRKQRNPFNRQHPYSISCPDLSALLTHSSVKPFNGSIPW